MNFEIELKKWINIWILIEIWYDWMYHFIFLFYVRRLIESIFNIIVSHILFVVKILNKKFEKIMKNVKFWMCNKCVEWDVFRDIQNDCFLRNKVFVNQFNFQFFSKFFLN